MFEWLHYLDSEQADGFPAVSGKSACERNLVAAAKELGKEPLSLFVADLDFFKRINDTLGHRQADRVLAHITELLRATLGRRGKGFRWGCEELVGILPEFTEEEAGAVAERLRVVVEQTSFPGLSAGEVTVSIGVAELGDDEHTDELFERADESVYAAKKMGRNRVYLASGRPWRSGTPAPRLRMKKLVYIVDREKFIRDILSDFIGMDGYDARAFTSAVVMCNETDAPDVIIAGFPMDDSELAGLFRLARARWPTVQLIGLLSPVG